MTNISRRKFLACAAAAPAILKGAKPTDIRIEDVKFSYEDFKYRAPLKFGGQIVDRVTLLNVDCVVRTAAGKSAKGFGSMPMGATWAYATDKMDYNAQLNAMKALAVRINKITADYKGSGHPIDINEVLEPQYLKAAAEVSRELKLPVPIPKLCMQVTASPFDAAIHDAYGKVHGVHSYYTYGPEFMTHDLSRYLGAQFKGEYLDRYVTKEPKPTMPCYHLIGAVDPLVESDIAKRINDGMPETLPEWIMADGLTHLKIKLNGNDLKWDVDRVVRVEKVAAETQKRRGVTKWVYSADFNEKCPNVDYLLGFLRQVKERAPAAFERIQYVEQPTKRDLKADRANVMHAASKLRPVVIDESLTDMESLLLAREMGYTGAALKACKQQTQALLMAAAAQKFKMFLCVQDLTCPGASLIHSAGIAAHVHGVAAIEANARQYVPAANAAWEKRFPGVFKIRNGVMRTGLLNGKGLGAV